MAAAIIHVFAPYRGAVSIAGTDLLVAGASGIALAFEKRQQAKTLLFQPVITY